MKKMLIILLGIVILQTTEANASDKALAEPIITTANIPSPPKYIADPSLTSSVEVLPEWTENGIIDLTKECKKIKWTIQNIVSASNYCKNDSDCVKVQTIGDSPLEHCSGIFVDKRHKDRVTNLIQGYQGLCGTSLSICEFPPNKILCEKSRCVGRN